MIHPTPSLRVVGHIERKKFNYSVNKAIFTDIILKEPLNLEK
jgi:hypothetical protein